MSVATVGSAEVRIDADVVPMLRQIRRALKGVKGVVEIDTKKAVANTKNATKELTTMERALKGVGVTSGAVLSSVARLGSTIGRGIGNATRVVGQMVLQFAVLATFMGVATVAAARFVAAIGPGVLSVAAGAIAILAAGVALAIPAFRNFIPAVKGSDEALGKLSPSARAAAVSLRQFSTVFNGIRAQAQETAFKGVSGALDTLRSNLTRLNPQVLDVSSALNTAMVGALTAVNNRFGDVETISSAAATTFQNLSRTVQPLVEGLLAIAAAGAKIGASFSDEVANRLERAGNAMTAFAEGGGVERSVDRAAAAFGRLRDSLQGLFSFFSAVLDVATEFGKGFSQSFAGTDDVGESLRLLGESLREFGPAARDFGAAVGNIARGFIALKPVLVPAVEAVAAFAKALTSIPGVAPLIALSAILARIGVSVGAQRAAIIAFGNALRTIVTAAARARVILAVAVAIRAVTTAVGALVGAIGGVAAAIVIVIALVAAFALALVIFPQFRARVLEVVQAIGGALVSAFQAVLGFFQSLPGLILGFVTTFLTTIVNAFLALPGLIIQAIITLPGLLIQFFFSALGTVLAFIITALGEIVVFWLLLPGRIISAVSSLLGLLVGFFGSVFSAVGGAIAAGISAAISFFAALPGRVLSAAAALPGLLRTLATNALSAFGSAISSGIENALNFFRSLPGRIQGLLSGAGKILVQAGQNIIQGLINGIESMIRKVGDAISKVTKKIRDALPFSPAKEGPLSGQGSPDIAGAKIAQMIAGGIRSAIPAIRKATNEAARAASVTVPGASGASPGPRIVRNNTSSTNVSVNVITGSTDGNALAAILGRRLILGGA